MDSEESDAESECQRPKSPGVALQGTLAALPGKKGKSGQTTLAVETFR